MAIDNGYRPASPLEIWRRSRGLSRADLGALAGVHRETIARCERGDTAPHGQTLLALARVLNVPAEALLAPDHPAEADET